MFIKCVRLGSAHRMGQAKGVPTPVISTCYRAQTVCHGSGKRMPNPNLNVLWVLIGSDAAICKWSTVARPEENL